MRVIRLIQNLLSVWEGDKEEFLKGLLDNVIIIQAGREYKYDGDGMLRGLNNNLKEQLMGRRITGVMFPVPKLTIKDGNLSPIDLEIDFKIGISPIADRSIVLDIGDLRIRHLFKEILDISEDTKYLRCDYKDGKLTLIPVS